MKLPFIKSQNRITVYINGNSYSATTEHPCFIEIVELMKTEDVNIDELVELFDTTKAIVAYGAGSTEVKDGVIYYKGEALHNTLTEKLLAMMSEGFNIEPLVKFLDNLKQNPARHAQQELYDFLEAGSLPITEDGHFLAYKAVRHDYKDYHSGTIYNRIGDIVEMDRGDVCDNREVTCSYGLHFAQKSYAESFGSNDGHLMILKINPKDVVSIPIDYNNTKGRCSRYEVIAEASEFKKYEKVSVFKYDNLSDEDYENDYENDDYEYEDD